jgi:hypothetical protein
MSQTVILVKKENVLGNRVPVGQTATFKLRDDQEPAGFRIAVVVTTDGKCGWSLR